MDYRLFHAITPPPTRYTEKNSHARCPKANYRRPLNGRRILAATRHLHTASPWYKFELRRRRYAFDIIRDWSSFLSHWYSYIYRRLVPLMLPSFSRFHWALSFHFGQYKISGGQDAWWMKSYCSRLEQLFPRHDISHERRAYYFRYYRRRRWPGYYFQRVAELQGHD